MDALGRSRISLRSSGLQCPSTPSPRNQKAGTGPAVLSKWFCSRWEPGRSEAPPGLEKLLLLGLLGLLRLFRLLRFLSHGILSRFNGWKRDTRHARRRASLATSSNAIPTDSRRAAPHCHAPVIALSTAVMRFGAFFAAVRRSAPKNPYSRERSHLSRDPGRVNDAPTRGRILHRSGTGRARCARDLHQFKTTAPIAPSR